MPLMMAPAEKAIDMEEYSKKWNNKKETSTFSCYDNQSECFVNSLKHVLIEAKETGLLCWLIGVPDYQSIKYIFA